MSGIISYSGIATKTRAMRGKLLTREDYASLAELKSVADAVTYLRQHTAYGGLLKEVTESRLHRGVVEELLLRSLYEDFNKIYYFCNLKQRRVLELYFCKYEIQMLKSKLRSIFNPVDEEELAAEIREFQGYSGIDREKLVEASSIPELTEALKRTPYYDVFRQLAQGGEKALFDYEMALDLFYFSNIWSKKEKLLKGKERAMFTKVYGSQIDMLNMMWIYRAKNYYQIPPAGIFTLVIPISYRLKKDQVIRMASAENEKQLYAAVQETYYGRRYKELKERDLELLYRQSVRDIYHGEKRRNPYSMTAVTAYLFDKEQEIDQITTLLECIRYGVEPGETLKYIL